ENVKKIFEPATKESLLEELECILRRRWKLELIKELFRLAHADDDLDQEELSFIDEVGDKMGIEKEKTEQISNWVVDFMVWKEQGKIIFEENGK
ncbi:MAG: TerB family tellurite resistance protein, partial [Alphaproteobacteria bacterium]|nr:TerB family tellurite resistance protein [Alphaproteobacteria bacterium]